jgi:acyl-CoA thioester hydrolase
MKSHEVQLRVRYSETDQMGVVYHGNYLPYFEIGRVEWLRDKGVSYKWMEENGIGLPIVSLTLNYKKSAKYDELLTVRTTFKSQSSVKIDFDCEITNEHGELLTTMYIMLVFVNFKTGRPTAPPDYIKTILEKIENVD